MTNKTKWVWAICVKGGSVCGCYEAYSLSEVIKQMVKHYVDQNEYPGEIIRIFATTETNKEISLRSKAVSKVNRMVEKCVNEAISEWNRKTREQEDYESELRGDYYASVL